ncbi:MAG: 50S ribosomal protein L35 [Planctomycetota bacterium]
MGKLKPIKAAVKRIKITGRGKVKIYKMGKSHLLSGKNSKRRRKLRTRTTLTGASAKAFRKALLL